MVSSSGSPSSENEQYGEYVGRIARGAGLSFSGQGAGRLLNYATQVSLAWMYGPTQLGFYVLGITLVQIANIVAQFGMDNGVVRYVAHYRAEGDVPRVRGTIVLALWSTLALSVVLALLMYLSASFLAGHLFHKPSLESVFEAFAVSLPFLTLMNIAVYITVGFQTVRYLTYVQQFVQPLVNVLFIVVFYLLGVQILGAVAAYILSTLAGSVVALYYLRKTFPGLLDRTIPAKFETRALFDASWPLILFSFTQRINSWTAVIVLGVFASASAVGIYNTAARTAMLSALVLFAFNGIFSPMISSLYKKGQLEDLSQLYQDVSRWVFAGGLAVFLGTLLVGGDVLRVLGPEFVSGWTTLILIAAAQLFNSSVGPTQRVLAMTGHQKMLMIATVGSSVLGVVASVVLVPFYGILGAAVATAAAIVLMNAITLLYVRRLLNFWPYSPLYAKPVVAGVLATVVVYAMKLVLPVPSGIPAMLVFGAMFLVGFAALLLVLGPSSSDRQLLGALWAAVRRTAKRPA